MIKHLVCALFGHKNDFNGQNRETVDIYKLNGKKHYKERMIEREWCSRCQKLLKEYPVNINNKQHLKKEVNYENKED